MKMRKCLGFVLALALVAGSFGTPTSAAEIQNYEELPAEFQRSTGSFSVTISPGKVKKANNSFTLEAGESVTVDMSYTPRNASVDVGLVDSNNGFTYFNVTSSPVDSGVITVTKRGTYTLAIRNNSSDQVDASGFVEC